MASTLELTQRILDLLEELSYASLKDLFWTELGYPRVAAPLSCRGWPEPERDLLAEEPVLLASVGEGGGFHVLYCRMAAERLSVGDERHVVTRLLREHPYALFVFSNRAQDAWHFVNVKIAVPWEGEEAHEPGRKQLFRRISVERHEPNRTGAEQLAKLDVRSFPGEDGASPLAIQEAHDQAFDVEKVTEEFYRVYRKVFESVERAITGFEHETEKKRRFTQRLFNRLMFIVFIQKKGWLHFPEPERRRQPVGYLYSVWRDYLVQKAETPAGTDNFYRDRLLLLFGAVLNGERDLLSVHRDGVIQSLVGTGPYLNGGLFEEDGLDKTPGVVVPDDAIYFILHDLFGRFNFTITEASPLEVEVAVDPEMLGKVFEELVTGRHETGSYYTPKPVVSFMCREALKGYLANAVPGESAEAIARFVDEHVAASLKDGEAILRALRRVKACDPACGSGAYLLGMLHELLDLRAALFNTRGLDTPSTYERKLEIIETNVFGADVDGFAVETARLRLWLSLVVDYEGGASGGALPRLPNLEYKIGEGDSLAHAMVRQYDLVDSLVRRIARKEHEYLRATRARRTELRAELGPLRTELGTWVEGGRIEEFDMRVDFADVFVPAAVDGASRPDGAPGANRPGGFDIVVANPPYVRQELIRAQKARLAANFPEVYTGMADLYVFFYARAMEMLAPGGMLVFISSNKWFRAAYGAKLRKFLGERAHVRSIADFGDLPVFKSASAYPMIFIAEKSSRPDRAGLLFAQPTSLDPPYPDIRAVLARTQVRLPPQAVRGSEWSLSTPESGVRTAAMTRAGVPLDQYVGGKIYYGVKTGLNRAFVIDTATRSRLIEADPRSAEVIKPLAHGTDIRRWSFEVGDQWLIYCPWGIQIDHYPAVKVHLARWQPALSARPECRSGRYAWWCLARYGAEYAEEFPKRKLVFPDIAKHARFAYDPHGVYIANTGYMIPVEDFYLLGVLNSAAVERFYADISSQVRGGYLRFIRQYVERVPIPQAGPRDREAVAELAQHCVDAAVGDAAVAEWEAEIDDRVATLYGLTARERAA